MDSIERWKPITGYENLYEVSSFGRIKSIPRDTKNQFSEGLIRKFQIDRYGYETIGLVKNNKNKTFTVHRIVSKEFIENPLNLPQVNHIDGNKTNNTTSNLEWCDSFHNQKHRFNELGHVAHNRELSKEQVFEILSKKGKGWRKEIAHRFNVSESCIKAIRTGRNYNNWYKEFMGLSIEQLVSFGWVKLKED